jgi:hypothetical protein
MAGMTNAQDSEPTVKGLMQRVKELEDTVLYLSNTLAMHGVLTTAEAGVARRMHDEGRMIRRETGGR